MKKTALFLVFTLLLTMVGGMTTVYGAHTQIESFEISPTETTKILGNCYTRTGWTDAHNNGTYWYAVEASYGWCEWDLNVLEAGMYKISIKSGTDGAASKMKISRNSIKNDSTGNKKATELVSYSIVPGKVSSIWDKTVTDLATIYLEKGISTIQLDNVGARKYVHEINITPVDDNVKIERTVSECDSKDLNDKNTYSDDNGEKYHMLHSGRYINHKINIPETGNYLLSLNYLNYYTKTYAGSVTISTGKTEDALTTVGSYTLPAKVWTKGEADYLINVPITVLSLEAGEQFIQIKGSAEPYIGKMTLEKFDELVLDDGNDETVDPVVYNVNPIAPTTQVIPSGIGKKYCAATGYEYEVQARNMEETYNLRAFGAGKYDVYMNLAMPSTYGYQITLSVDGVEQSFERSETNLSTGWSDYQYQKVGSITLPKGTSALTINSKAYSYTDSETAKTRYYGYFYFKGFKLVPSGTELSAKAYTDTEPNFTTSSFNKTLGINVDSEENTDNVVRLSAGNSVSYNVNVSKAGIYGLSALSNSGAANAEFVVSANDRQVSVRTDFGVMSEYAYNKLGYVYLNKGDNAVTITLTSGSKVDILALYTEAAEITLHADNSKGAKVEGIVAPEEGKAAKSYAVKVDFNGALEGKIAIVAAGVYDNSGRLVDVKLLRFEANGTEIKTLTLSNANLEEGKNYTVKAFLWDQDTLFGLSEVF